MATEQKITYAPFVTPGMKALQTGQRAKSQFNTLADMAGLQLAKDIEIEERAQEAEKLRLAAVQREMLKGADKKAKKRKMIQDILIGGGAAIGSIVPGVGTAGGGALGGAIATLFGKHGGSVPSGVPAPTGKFNRSGYEQLVRDQEFLGEQEKAIKRAQKRTFGTFLAGASRGYSMGKGIESGLDMLKSANIGERLNMLLNRGQDKRGGIALNQGFKNIIPDTLEFTTSPSWLSPVGKDPYANAFGLDVDFTFDNVKPKKNSMLSLTNNSNSLQKDSMGNLVRTPSFTR